MPTRNHAHFIRASIDSVLSQSYKERRVGWLWMALRPMKPSRSLKSYGDKIRWIAGAGQEVRRTPSTKVCKRSVAKSLAYLNSDDILLPGALEKVVDYFNDYPECDLVYGNADYIDEDGKITGTLRLPNSRSNG